MSATRMFTAFGAVVLAAGLWLGFSPLHSTSGEDCGSPFDSKVKVLELAGALGDLGSAYSGSGFGDLGFSGCRG